MMNARNDHRYTVKVIIRSDVIRKDGRAALALQAFVNGKRKVIPIGCAVDPRVFDKQKQQVGSAESADLMNALIHKAKSRAEKIFYQAILDDKPLTADRFAEIFVSTASRNDFYQFMIDEMTRSKDVKEKSSLKNDRKVINRLKEFRPTLLMHEINYEFIDEFHRFLKHKKLETNTIWSYHKGLKAAINAAIRRGHRMDQPYKDFKMAKARTERVFLDLGEVDRLIKLYRGDKLSEKLKRTARLFLFQCFSGLRIQDVMTLTQDNIVHDTLVFRPHKTKHSLKILKIPLSETARKILDDERATHTGSTLFRSITQPRVNDSLKDLAKELKLNKRVTTHVGRHTFAAMFLIRGGKVQVLQQILGHSDIRTTMVYVHVTESQKESMVKSIDEYFTGHLVEWK